MSKKQVAENYYTSHSDLKLPLRNVKNLVHCDPIDFKFPSSSKQQAIQNTSRFSDACARGEDEHPFPHKRARVHATRDFPPRCGDGKGFPSVVSTEQLHAPNTTTNKPTNYDVKTNQIANVRDIPHDIAVAEKNKVKETLKLFRDIYNQLSDEYKAKGKRIGTPRFDVEAANLLKKKGKFINTEKRLGHTPGIAVGDKFHYRAELALVGLHCQYIWGIDYMLLNRKKFAISVVNSGRYENKAKTVDVLIYSGEGGQVGLAKKIDQKLKRGNLALFNSMEKGYPVRVIRRIENPNKQAFYTYDGLYIVKRYWQERDRDRKLVFKFELHRMSAQQNLEGMKRITQRELCMADDVSQGNENMPIRAMNGIDGEKPPSFAYITNMIYPEWCKKIPKNDCNCIKGCSTSGECVCISKSEKSSILRQKGILYACGSSCKCPVSCTNRIGQQGQRYKLEIYKTETREWGVRSKSFIAKGSFVCEYVGKLQRTRNVGSGFTVDASKMGNVGRFIRYGTSPNLSVQHVLYDHEDERMPHIMIFASKNIPPLHELTWDYNCSSMLGNFQFQYLL